MRGLICTPGDQTWPFWGRELVDLGSAKMSQNGVGKGRSGKILPNLGKIFQVGFYRPHFGPFLVDFWPKIEAKNEGRSS